MRETRPRKGLARGLLTMGIIGALFVGSAINAIAHDPGPGGRVQNGWFFTNLTGYLSPPANYTTGQAFSFSVSVRNPKVSSQEACFQLEVYRMTDLSATTGYTEAQLEGMVNNGQNATEALVTTLTKTVSFTGSQTQTVTFGTTINLAGYYQFDMGLCGTGPFAPRPGFVGPPVSGFVRYLPSSQVSGVTTTPAPTTSGTGAANLAKTGGGPASAAPPVVSALLGLVGLGLVGLGFVAVRRRRTGTL